MNMTVVWVIVAAAVVAVGAAVATARASRLGHAAARWVAVAAGTVVTVVATVAAVILALGLYRLRERDDHPLTDIEVTASAAALERGERLARACAGCHSSTRELPLDGSDDNFLEGLGTLHAPNLTPGGPLGDRSDGRIARAIREGVGVDGRPLLIMPSAFFHAMSDDDVAAIIAYLRTEPEIDDEVPEREIGPMGTLLIGAGMFPLAVQEPIDDEVEPPDTDDDEEWGEYTATIMACAECHGDDFRGRNVGDGPQGPDIAHFADDWTAEEWRDTIRTGVDPEDNELDPDEMPWEEYSAALTDGELEAIRVYVRTFAEDDDDDE